MKRTATYLLTAFLLLLPLLIYAQAAGGQVKHPVKSEPKPVVNKSSNQNRPKQTTMTQAGREFDHIIQNLINNMVYVEGGTFMMGRTPEQMDRNDVAEVAPVHQVTLSSFFIGKYEVTQEEWQAVMGSNPSCFKGAKLPVENVSWDDCQKFIRKLNAMTGKSFRLPTEAEWEYAARGGNKSRGYRYAGSNGFHIVAWTDNSDGTHAVGQLQANELGLYDMSGNVWEWCQDWYDAYSSSAQTNPAGPSSGSHRVLRGGSWSDDFWICIVSARDYDLPRGNDDNYGLRLALQPSSDSLQKK